MSDILRHAGRMKVKKSINIALTSLIFQNTIVAQFGPARLVRKPDGRHELIGGTAGHRGAAREWFSIFAPEVVFNIGGTLQGAAQARRPIASGATPATHSRLELL
jgi:hypothetical protein